MKVSDYLKLSNEELEKELRYLNKQYREGNPLIADDVYDYLLDTLKERDPTNTFFKEIGAPIVEEKNKVELPYKMFSLDKIKNEEKPFQRWRIKYPGDVVVSHKLDGNSGLLYIKNGKISLYTRGDGFIGQDISFLVPYISIFQSEEYKQFLLDNYDEVSIRGELILSKKDWEYVSSKIQGLSNPRNTVAGTLNAKAPNALILSKIRFVSYEWIVAKTNTNQIFGNFEPSTSFELMKTLGLEVVDYKLIKAKQVSLDNFSEYLQEARDKGAYEVDGIVVSENKVHPRDESGNPDYSFAFKSLVFQEQIEVMVTFVEWNVSKDGVLKPLVHFPKVNLNGVDIQKATGFNAKFIEENQIGPGSKIVIIRSGDVIPHILQVLKPSPTGPEFPDIDYIWNSTHVDIKINQENIDQEILEELEVKRLTHFFVKFDTEGVAEGIVKKLYQAGFKTVKSILNITIDQLLTVEGIQQRSAEKTRMNLDLALAKATPLKVMVASNMFENGFGERKIKPIITAYPGVANNEKRYIPSMDEMLSLEGFAEISATNFITHLPKFWKFIDENELGFLMKYEEKIKNQKESTVQKESNGFLQQTFVFSGFRNKSWETLIEAAGGKVSSSVSKNTNLVIVKDIHENSTKIIKAKDLGIPIYSIDEVSSQF